MVAVREEINALKEKNAQKAVEVAKLIKAQTPIYEESLNKGTAKLGDVLPGDKQELKANINQALEEMNKTKQVTDELIKNEPSTVAPDNTQENKTPEQTVVPQTEEKVESSSMPFENLQPSTEKVGQ